MGEPLLKLSRVMAANLISITPYLTCAHTVEFYLQCQKISLSLASSFLYQAQCSLHLCHSNKPFALGSCYFGI